ncbi:hypothetical protein D3C80_1680970 [compost metagenome]
MEGSHAVDFVGLDQGEGRTLHRPDMAEAAQNAARQGGLAGAQVPVQVDDSPSPADCRDPPAQFVHGFLAIGEQIQRHGFNSSSN